MYFLSCEEIKTFIIIIRQRRQLNDLIKFKMAARDNHIKFFRKLPSPVFQRGFEILILFPIIYRQFVVRQEDPFHTALSNDVTVHIN